MLEHILALNRCLLIGPGVRYASSKGSSSSRYLARQKGDSFVRSRLERNYVSRAAFKLLQLDDKYRFLSKAKRVVDLGASPGGFTQVAFSRMAKGKGAHLFALDLLDLDDQVIRNIPASLPFTFLRGDFTSFQVQSKLLTALRESRRSGSEEEEEGSGLDALQSEERKVDVILSDMMVNTSGNSIRDAEGALRIYESVAAWAQMFLSHNGWLILKYFDGAEAQAFQRNSLNPHFRQITRMKPPASRKESKEMYFICTGFRNEKK